MNSSIEKTFHYLHANFHHLGLKPCHIFRFFLAQWKKLFWKERRTTTPTINLAIIYVREQLFPWVPLYLWAYTLGIATFKLRKPLGISFLLYHKAIIKKFLVYLENILYSWIPFLKKKLLFESGPRKLSPLIGVKSFPFWIKARCKKYPLCFMTYLNLGSWKFSPHVLQWIRLTSGRH